MATNRSKPVTITPTRVTKTGIGELSFFFFRLAKENQKLRSPNFNVSRPAP